MAEIPKYIDEAAEKLYPALSREELIKNSAVSPSENYHQIDLQEAFIAGAMSPEARRMNGGWVTEKPEFTEDCLLLTASWIKSDKYWSYSLFEIKKTDGETEEGEQGWYWGIFENGDEWGDIADLRAQLYKIISALPEPPVE